VTLEPALVIQRFANGDAVKPSLKRTALAEVMYPAKGFEKNFLGSVGGVSGIAKHAEDQVIDRGVVVSDDPIECGFGAGLQLGNEFGLVATPR